MAKIKFRMKKRTKKNNNLEVNNTEQYNEEVSQENESIESLTEDINLEKSTSNQGIDKKSKLRKKKRKMRFRNPLVKLMKKL